MRLATFPCHLRLLASAAGNFAQRYSDHSRKLLGDVRDGERSEVYQRADALVSGRLMEL
jgi:hypothetical protein